MTVLLRRLLTLGVLTALVVAPMTTSAEAATPGAATRIVATPTVDAVTLTWKAAKHTTHYRACLLVKKTQKRCSIVTKRALEPTVTITGLKQQAGTDYYVRIYSYGNSLRTSSTLKGFELVSPKPPAAPADVTGVVSTSGLTVTWSAAAGALDYRVCLRTSATTPCAFKSPRSTTRKATFTALVPTGGTDYYYRVYAYNASGYARSASFKLDLPVSTVRTATAVRSGSGVLRASWSAVTNAEEYELQIARNASMTTDLTTRVIAGNRTAASPSRLPLGQTYYYRVRGTNGVIKGGYSPVGSVRMPSENTAVAVLTYNLCGQNKCVTRGNKMKKWSSTRKKLAGRIVRESEADIIATQESHAKDTRFGTELPGYGLAAYYSAKSLFYDKSKYAVTRSGTITLSKKERKYAVWAEFIGRKTRTSFIVADVHLQPYKGRTKDNMRYAQSRVLLSQIKRINKQDVPVIYAGDFNSNKSNTDQKRYKGGYDAPLKAFRAAGVPDTVDEAKKPIRADWNSANQSINPPLRHSDHVDHIFADRDIKVDRWRVILDLTSSRKRYATPFATDHNAIRANLTVPGR